MYEDVFEKKFLQATENLYAAEGQKYMQDNDVCFNFVLHFPMVTPMASGLCFPIVIKILFQKGRMKVLVKRRKYECLGSKIA